MTFTMCLNLQKVNEWKLRLRTIPVMGVFADLESWATCHKSNDVDDDNLYYLLYREKILVELPFLRSVSTISRAIKELEDKGIVKCINKNTTPAYCLTSKGMEWKRKPDSQKNSNVVGGTKAPSKKQPPKEPNKFQFVKKTSFKDLDKEFMRSDLYTACIKVATNMKIGNPKAEFEKFIVHNSATNGTWFNWVSAFSSWCLKHQQLQKKINGGYDGSGYNR